MSEVPLQRSDAVPDQIADGIPEAQAILDDPSKRNTPEWLAAKQLLSAQSSPEAKPKFVELEREMESLRGMSEI